MSTGLPVHSKNERGNVLRPTLAYNGPLQLIPFGTKSIVFCLFFFHRIFGKQLKIFLILFVNERKLGF